MKLARTGLVSMHSTYYKNGEDISVVYDVLLEACAGGW